MNENEKPPWLTLDVVAVAALARAVAEEDEVLNTNPVGEDDAVPNSEAVTKMGALEDAETVTVGTDAEEDTPLKGETTVTVAALGEAAVGAPQPTVTVETIVTVRNPSVPMAVGWGSLMLLLDVKGVVTTWVGSEEAVTVTVGAAEKKLMAEGYGIEDSATVTVAGATDEDEVAAGIRVIEVNWRL